MRPWFTIVGIVLLGCGCALMDNLLGLADRWERYVQRQRDLVRRHILMVPAADVSPKAIGILALIAGLGFFLGGIGLLG